MLKHWAFLFPTALLLSDASAKVLPVMDLPIVNKEIAPDGIKRSATLAGGVFPGPLITANKGDKLRINVIDELTDDTMDLGTTVHWHGMHQHKSNWADGVAWVTQCPIEPGNSFLYEFEVKDQAGTFWYHSHIGAQYCDGLRGPLIIYDPDDPLKQYYDVDDESTILSLSDWYHRPSVGLVPVAHIAPQIDSVLFNGKGRYELDDEALKSEITIVNVEKGKRYRLRLVQMACDTELVFNIDGHTFDIIEVEGTAVHPYTVDQFTINEGQRYSVVLNANQEVGNYWIHATPYPGRQERPYTFKGGANSALLRYKGAPEVEPPPTQQPSKAQKPFFEHELVPLEVIPAPGKPGLGNADVNLILKLGVDFNIFNFTMNGVAYHSPNVPVLLQILSGAKLAQDFFPVGSVYPLPKNKVIEVSIPGIEEGGPHPFHLHGHDMFVVRSAYSDKVNYENPIRRDVVNTGMEESNVTFRFTTNNSGPWFLHCHIDAHLADLGMAVIFAEAPEDVQEDVQPPDAWKDLCPIYNQLRPTKQRLFEHI